MAIWFKELQLEDVQKRGKGTMVEHLGIEFTGLGDDYLEGIMPVDERTIQPMGILHGGASIALAETLGSLAAELVIDASQKYCVGIEVNGNHIKSAKKGFVTGIATPIHLGSSTQVWNINIKNEEGQLVCISRLTMAVLTKNN
jgi:1,4-dihydroxy-2-naphthoyl-CoA hydrolase